MAKCEACGADEFTFETTGGQRVCLGCLNELEGNPRAMPIPPAPPAEEKENVAQSLANIMAWTCFVLWALGFAISMPTFVADNQFDGKTAMGSTANSLKGLTTMIASAVAIVLAALFWILAALLGISRKLDSRQQQAHNAIVPKQTGTPDR